MDWRNGRVCFNSFGCPSPLVKSTQRHRLPALTVTLKSLESAFIDAVSKRASQRHNEHGQLFACLWLAVRPSSSTLPHNTCTQCPAQPARSRPCHTDVCVSNDLCAIQKPTQIGHRNNVSLPVLNSTSVLLLACGRSEYWCEAATRWCNSDSTIVQNMALSEISSECRASAIIESWSMPAMIMAMAWMSILWFQTTRSICIVNINNRNANRQQTSETNLCLLILEAGVVAAIAIAIYFLFPAHKASSKKQVLSTAGHTWECVLSWHLSRIRPSSACFYTVRDIDCDSCWRRVLQVIHKTEAVAYLRKHKMKLGQWVRTTERRMLLSLVTLAIPFVCMFAVVSWLASNDVFENHQERLREFLFCKLTSCYPEECARYVRCTCSFGHIDGNLFLRCCQNLLGIFTVFLHSLRKDRPAQERLLNARSSGKR